MNAILMKMKNDLKEEIIERYFSPEYFAADDIIALNENVYLNLSQEKVRNELICIILSDEFKAWYFNLAGWLDMFFRKYRDKQSIIEFIVAIKPKLNEVCYNVYAYDNMSIKETIKFIATDYLDEDEIKEIFKEAINE
jgi:hypothetical protein